MTAYNGGLQRLQGRKPFAWAWQGVSAKVTFLRRGLRAGQPGLQYMPVVLTQM